MIAPSRRKTLAVLVLTASLAGCARKEVNHPRAPAEAQLHQIGTAYARATGRLGRAPRYFDEIKSDLGESASEDLLRSPNDSEPFVILWGVNFNQIPPTRDDPYVVAGYERRGVDGKRYVLRFPLGVTRMTEEELKKAVFPPGHKPPA